MDQLLLIIHSISNTMDLPPMARPQAYLDPGSGSFILQVVLAALLGGLFMLRAYWKKVIGFFRRSGSKEEDTQKDESVDSE